jgi:hypothetical protein
MPDIVDVQAGNVGIVGADIHAHDDRPLIRDVLLRMPSESATGNRAKHILREFNAGENILSDARLNILQLLDRVVDVSDLGRLRLCFTPYAGIWVWFLCCLKRPVQFVPTLQQCDEFTPFRAETVFEIA